MVIKLIKPYAKLYHKIMLIPGMQKYRNTNIETPNKTATSSSYISAILENYRTLVKLCLIRWYLF